MNAPIDRTHEESLAAISWIRGLVVDLKIAAAKFDIRPMPEDFR